MYENTIDTKTSDSAYSACQQLVKAFLLGRFRKPRRKPDSFRNLAEVWLLALKGQPARMTHRASIEKDPNI